METLPLITFGKYKGQPITSLYSDPKYLEWCKQQYWFQKTTCYNIIVKQVITPDKNSKTPEHNKLQKTFLNKDIALKFVNKIYPLLVDEKDNTDFTTEFEGMFIWDLIVDSIYRWKCICDLKEDDSLCSCKYEKDDDICKNSIFCEIKPSIGDDYPSVLRKMKTQIELTRKSKNNDRLERLKSLGYTDSIGGCKWNDLKEIRGLLSKIPNGWNSGYYPNYVLLVGKITTDTITREELVKIFNQTYITVIFVEELDIVETVNVETVNVETPTIELPKRKLKTIKDYFKAS